MFSRFACAEVRSVAVIRPALMAATLVAGLAFGGIGAAVAEGNQVGFVNVGLLLEQSPQAEAVRKALEKEFGSRDKQMASEQTAIRQMQDKLRRDQATLSEGDALNQEREINRRLRELQRMQAEFREDLGLRRNEELAKLQKQLGDVITQVAKDRGYDLVLSDGVAYASTRADITPAVLEALKASR